MKIIQEGELVGWKEWWRRIAPNLFLVGLGGGGLKWKLKERKKKGLEGNMKQDTRKATKGRISFRFSFQPIGTSRPD